MSKSLFSIISVITVPEILYERREEKKERKKERRKTVVTKEE